MGSTNTTIEGFVQTPRIHCINSCCHILRKNKRYVQKPQNSCNIDFVHPLMLKHVRHHLIMSSCARFVQTKPPPHPHLTVIHSLYLRQIPSPHQAENKTAKDEMSINPHIIRPDSSAHTSAALQRSVMAWQPEIRL